MKIFLDIETIPLGEEPEFTRDTFPGVKVPANYKDVEKIEAYKKENYAKQLTEFADAETERQQSELNEWKKGALKATRSQIVCICAVSSGWYEPFQKSDHDEFRLLVSFSEWLQEMESHNVEFEFVGHNIATFDNVMIRNHAVKYKLEYLKKIFTHDRWSKLVRDTMTMWDIKNWTKLTEIAEFLGIKDLNEGTDGSDIYDLYKAGKFDEIETKCFNDVLMCKEVYERIS
jgi:hypothetical protein